MLTICSYAGSIGSTTQPQLFGTRRRCQPRFFTKSKTVSVLRREIKEEKRPVFDHVPADTLVLWKVNITVDESIAEEY